MSVVSLPGSAALRVRATTAVAYLAAAAAIVLDQATKRIAEVELVRGRLVPWLTDAIGWELTLNDGGAFGFPAPSWFFLVVTAVVTTIVVRNVPHLDRERPALAYGLLLAGAWGNALDRIFRLGDPGDPRFLHGHVIDFVAWGGYPRFNVADIAITFGFVLLVIDLLLESREAASATTVLPAA